MARRTRALREPLHAPGTNGPIVSARGATVLGNLSDLRFIGAARGEKMRRQRTDAAGSHLAATAAASRGEGRRPRGEQSVETAAGLARGALCGQRAREPCPAAAQCRLDQREVNEVALRDAAAATPREVAHEREALDG